MAELQRGSAPPPAPTPSAPRPDGLRLLYAATLCNFTAFGAYFAAIQLFVEDELGGSRASVGLAVGAFSLSALLVRPFVGRGIDARGRRPFLLGALSLLALSSLGFLVIDAVPLVVALRLLQGVAGGTFYTTAAAVATDLAPLERRASAIARFSLFLYAGFATGPVVAELLIDRSGFAPVWLLTATLGAVGVACIWLLPETGTSAIAKRAELGAARRRLLHPAAIGPGLVLMTTGMGYASITGFSSLYGRSIGLDDAGLLYAAFALTILGVRLVAGRLADTVGRVAIALPGLVMAAVGLGVLALVQRPVAAFIGVAAFGAGFALIFPALMAFVVDRVEDHERGEALGSFTAFMDIGTGGGAYLIGAIADRAGFGWAYGTPALLCLGGAILLAGVARRDDQTVGADSPTGRGSCASAATGPDPGFVTRQ
ncbi:MAG: MFS transporter [Acidimicrobiia bacterium]|nr:MFS transporter [Acidimicrobiia bacterium]